MFRPWAEDVSQPKTMKDNESAMWMKGFNVNKGKGLGWN